jgi:DNA-directed RNA polymerase subunit K/omega
MPKSKPTVDDDDYDMSDEDDNESSSSESSEEYQKPTYSGVSKSVINPKKALQEGGDEDEDDIEEIANDEDENDDDVDEHMFADDSDDEDIGDIAMEGGNTENETPNLNSNKLPSQNQNVIDINNYDDDSDEEYEDENYLQKFDKEINENYIKENHAECIVHNYDEVNALSSIIRDSDNIICDPLHKTIPMLTKYEKTRVLGQRSKQIEAGCKLFVKVPESVIDSYVIAELELKAKAIPFIIKRPLPNGACEYWKLKDLEIIDF